MMPELGHGTHQQFVDLYDEFLTAKCGTAGLGRGAGGRKLLVESIAAEMRGRGATRALDCAAGIGFPMVDLLALSRREIEVHCSDGDQAMVGALVGYARSRNVPLRYLLPPRWTRRRPIQGQRAMVVDWAELDQIQGQYDYVLCRGNSLVYAQTWTGRHRVASEHAIVVYLGRIAAKVRPGGYLHVDAPWKLELDEDPKPIRAGQTLISEHVEDEEHLDRRKWTVDFEDLTSGQTLRFVRYSSRLTIDQVERALKALGFEQTAPFHLPAERSNFGVIIARKPG